MNRLQHVRTQVEQLNNDGINAVRRCRDRAEQENYATDGKRVVQEMRRALDGVLMRYPADVQSAFIEDAKSHRCGEVAEVEGVLNSLENEERDIAARLLAAGTQLNDLTTSLAGLQGDEARAADQLKGAQAAAVDAEGVAQHARDQASTAVGDLRQGIADHAAASAVADIAAEKVKQAGNAVSEAEHALDGADQRNVEAIAKETEARAVLDTAQSALDSAALELTDADEALQLAVRNLSQAAQNLRNREDARDAAQAQGELEVGETTDELRRAEEHLAIQIAARARAQAALGRATDAHSQATLLHAQAAAVLQASQHRAAVAADEASKAVEHLRDCKTSEDEARNVLSEALAKLRADEAEVQRLHALIFVLASVEREINLLQQDVQNELQAAAAEEATAQKAEGLANSAEGTIASMQRDHDNCCVHVLADERADGTVEHIHYHGRREISAVQQKVAAWRARAAANRTRAAARRQRVQTIQSQLDGLHSRRMSLQADVAKIPAANASRALSQAAAMVAQARFAAAQATRAAAETRLATAQHEVQESLEDVKKNADLVRNRESELVAKKERLEEATSVLTQSLLDEGVATRNREVHAERLKAVISLATSRLAAAVASVRVASEEVQRCTEHRYRKDAAHRAAQDQLTDLAHRHALAYQELQAASTNLASAQASVRTRKSELEARVIERDLAQKLVIDKLQNKEQLERRVEVLTAAVEFATQAATTAAAVLTAAGQRHQQLSLQVEHVNAEIVRIQEERAELVLHQHLAADQKEAAFARLQVTQRELEELQREHARNEEFAL